MDERWMEGLWMARPEGTVGAGLVILAARENRIVGADLAYNFGGHYLLKGDCFDVTISSKRTPGAPDDVLNIWGGREDVDLVLSGFANPNRMVLGGHFAGDNRSPEIRVEMIRLRHWPDGLTAKK
jgi:hypothetical protein